MKESCFGKADERPYETTPGRVLVPRKYEMAPAALAQSPAAVPIHEAFAEVVSQTSA